MDRVTNRNLEKMQYPEIRSSWKPLHPRSRRNEKRDCFYQRIRALAALSSSTPTPSSQCLPLAGRTQKPSDNGCSPQEFTSQGTDQGTEGLKMDLGRVGDEGFLVQVPTKCLALVYALGIEE